MIKQGGLSFETQLKIEFLPSNNGSKKCLENSLLVGKVTTSYARDSQFRLMITEIYDPNKSRARHHRSISSCSSISGTIWKSSILIVLEKNYFENRGKILKSHSAFEKSWFYLLSWKPCKNDGKCFLFRVKSFLFWRQLNLSLDFLGHVGN